VLLPGNKVVYASNLAKAKPDVRTGPADQEKRYYLTWRRGGLQAADRELLGRAGVDTQNKIILKFLPPEVEAELARQEKVHAGSDAQRVRKTVFLVLPAGDGYTFKVTDQSFR